MFLLVAKNIKEVSDSFKEAIADEKETFSVRYYDKSVKNHYRFSFVLSQPEEAEGFIMVIHKVYDSKERGTGVLGEHGECKIAGVAANISLDKNKDETMLRVRHNLLNGDVPYGSKEEFIDVLSRITGLDNILFRYKYSTHIEHGT